MSESHKSVRIVISGLVQGVGFRHGTYLEATRIGATGWVRNLPDGRVEVLAVGETGLVGQLVQWCHSGPVDSRVDHVECEEVVHTNAYRAFEINF